MAAYSLRISPPCKKAIHNLRIAKKFRPKLRRKTICIKALLFRRCRRLLESRTKMKIIIPVTTLALLAGCSKPAPKVEPVVENATVGNEIAAPKLPAKVEEKKPAKK